MFVPPSPAISIAPPAVTVFAPLGEDKSIVPAPEPAVAIVGLNHLDRLKDAWNMPLPTTQMLATYFYWETSLTTDCMKSTKS